MAKIALPTNYWQAQGMTARARNGVRTIPNLAQTCVHVTHDTRPDGHDIAAVAVRYHFTDVVTFYSDGAMRLNHGGWVTPTTHARMNACLPSGWRVGCYRCTPYLYAPDGSKTAIGGPMVISYAQLSRGSLTEPTEPEAA